MKFFKNKIFKTVFIIFTAIVALYVVWTLGKPINYPWSLQTQVNAPQNACLDENNSVRALTDNNLTRLSFFNEQGQTIRSYQDSILSDSYCLYYDVCNYGDNYYVHKANVNIANGLFIDESIIYYDIKTNIESTVYKISYNQDSDKVKYPNILDMHIQKDSLIILICPVDANDKLQILSLNNSQTKQIKEFYLDNDNEQIYSASYNFVCDTLAYTTFSGDIYMSDSSGKFKGINKQRIYTLQKVSLLDNGDLYISNSMDNYVTKYSKGEFYQVINNVFANFISCRNNVLLVCDGQSNEIKLYSCIDENQIPVQIQNFSVFPYSINLCINIVFTWIAYAYVFICLIILIIFGIRMFKKNVGPRSKMLFLIGLTVVICIVGLSLYFSYNIYKQSENEKFSILKIACQEFINYNEEEIISFMSNNQESYASKNYETLFTNARKSLEAFSIGDTEISLDFLNIKDVGVFLDKFPNRIRYIEGGGLLENAQYLNGETQEFITAFLEGSEGDSLMAAKYVFNSDKMPCALIVAYCSNSILLINQLSYFISLIISLLVLAGSIVLIFLELKSFIENLKASIVKKLKNKKDYDFHGARILSFLAYFTYSLDVAIVVLVVQDMLPNDSFGDISVLLSLPLSLYALGSFIGCLITNLLIKNFKARTILSAIPFIYTIIEIASVLSVLNSMFVMFCLLKLLCGFLQIVFYNGINLIQYRANSAKEQSLIANDQSLACVSAGALGTLCAGHIADLFGNHSIYIAAAVFCICSLLCVLWFVPKNVYYLSNKKKSKSNESNINIVKFMFKPEMIIIVICLCFVAILINQYNAILFPLFANDANLNKGQIGDIIMFATCAVFFINSIFKKKFASASQYNLLVIAFGITSFALLCFALNDTIIWACLALIFITYAYRICMTIIKTIWIRLAKEDNVEYGKIYTIMMTLKSISCTIAPPVLSSLLIFGNSQAAFIVGIIVLISLLCFGVIMTIFHRRSIYRKVK